MILRKLFILALLAGPASADTVVLRLGAGEQTLQGVRILRLESGAEGAKSLVFSSDGREARRDAGIVLRVNADGEPVLNAAEEAFFKQDWETAATGFRRAASTSGKPWVREWAQLRLLVAAGKSASLSANVMAFVQGVVNAPPSAAMPSRPAIAPDATRGELDAAVAEVQRGLETPRLADSQKLAMLTLLADLHVARKDSEGIARVSAQLDAMLQKQPDDPSASTAVVARSITIARQHLAAGKFDLARQEIQRVRARIEDPLQQSEALWLLAEASAGLARQSGDPDQLSDAALDYMRVVAHFRAHPARPNVVASLMKAAELLEQLGKPNDARMIYADVAQTYSSDPLAAEAALRARKLSSSTP